MQRIRVTVLLLPDGITLLTNFDTSKFGIPFVLFTTLVVAELELFVTVLFMLDIYCRFFLVLRLLVFMTAVFADHLRSSALRRKDSFLPFITPLFIISAENTRIFHQAAADFYNIIIANPQKMSNTLFNISVLRKNGGIFLKFLQLNRRIFFSITKFVSSTPFLSTCCSFITQ